MKKIFFCFFFATLFFSCAPSGEFITDSPTGKILGTIRVEGGSYEVENGDTIYSDYIGNDIEAELMRQKDDTTKYNIVLYKVRFSNKMPVTIDMTIPAVDIDLQGNISGDNIVPYAGIFGEYKQYTIHNLTGKVVFDSKGQAGALTFSMLCGKYPTRYEGLYVTQ